MCGPALGRNQGDPFQLSVEQGTYWFRGRTSRAVEDADKVVSAMIAEGDKVAVCFTVKGTHDGAFQGIPATGKRYEHSAMTVWRFVNGKIAEEWVFSNDLDIYRQLGMFKDPGSTDH